MTQGSYKASCLSRESLLFFSDEIEKQAIISPATTLRFMGSKRPLIRGIGRIGAKMHTGAAKATPKIQSIASSYNPAAEAQAAIGDAAVKTVLGKAKVPQRVITGAQNIAKFTGVY